MFVPRQKKLLLHNSAPLQLQQAALEHLVECGKNTEYGQKHSFNAIRVRQEHGIRAEALFQRYKEL